MSEEKAPLKALPSTPGDDSSTNTLTAQSSIKSIINKNGLSEEITDFGHVVNGNFQNNGNLAGNLRDIDPIEICEDVAPTIPKRLSSIRRGTHSSVQREVPPPPVPSHQDQDHVSHGFHKPPKTSGKSFILEPQVFDNNMTNRFEPQHQQDLLGSKRYQDSISTHDTSSEIIDIDEAIGVSKVSFQLPKEHERKAKNKHPRHFKRDLWVGRSPFHNIDDEPNRPQSPSKHQYQEIGEASRKGFQFSNTNNPIADKGQWSSTDDNSVDSFSSKVSPQKEITQGGVKKGSN